MKNNFYGRLFFCGIGLLAVAFVLFKTSHVFCEDIYPDNLELSKSTNTETFDIMERISLLYHDLHVGPVGIKPSYKINEVFDDNVFSAPTNEVSDFYTSHKADVGLVYPVFDNLLTHLDYDAEIYTYERVQERDHINQSLKGVLEFAFPNDFKFSIADQIRKYTIPPGVQRRFYGDIIVIGVPIEDLGVNAFTPKANITRNLATFALDFPDFISNLDFSVQYVNDVVRYQEETFKSSEYNSNTIGATVEYTHPFFPIRLSSGFLYSYWQYYNYEEYSSTRTDIPFSVDWKINPKHDVYVNTHYKKSDYKSGSPIENFEGWEFVFGDRYYITPVSTIEVYAERSLKEQRRDDNNAFFYTVFGLKYVLKQNRFNTTIDTYYSHVKFREVTEALGSAEEVDGVNFHFNIKYTPQNWWFAEFDYTYTLFDDTVSLGNLNKNVVSLGVGLNF
ncbi:MAG: hypothetical protein HRU72_06750 [Planctomycetia bacterium]|nr:hypothetical protein [Candidatus Brocadia sp.]QOJ06272.1 MAG: hypothetical protein HRU72_06750 [Planctomycetia bacterium]HQU31576.1 hypothetical protein [Candidatus Brocadia sapporoensis]